MKKIITLIFLSAALVCNAQDGPPSKEEHMKKHMEMMQKELQLNANQQTQFQQVMKDFMNQAEEIHKNNPPPPPPPMDPKVKAAMDKIVNERNDQLKKILSEDQYKNFLEKEKNMPHPPPPPRINGEGKQPTVVKS